MNFQDYIVITRPTTTEDEYGDLVVSTETTVAEFWADVKEIKPTLQEQSGAILQTRRVEITADSRDTDAVDIGDIVTINNLSNNEFVVMNQHESDWRWHRTIIAQFTNR